MTKHDYMKITGQVVVTVDDVDIEQEIILQPWLAEEEKGTTAMYAAQSKEAFTQICLCLFKSGHTLELSDYAELRDGKFDVKFIVKYVP